MSVKIFWILGHGTKHIGATIKIMTGEVTKHETTITKQDDGSIRVETNTRISYPRDPVFDLLDTLEPIFPTTMGTVRCDLKTGKCRVVTLEEKRKHNKKASKSNKKKVKEWLAKQ